MNLDDGTRPSLAELQRELDDASRVLAFARKTESSARDETLKCLNRYNRASKAFDERVAEIRGNAPSESDWSRSRRRELEGGED